MVKPFHFARLPQISFGAGVSKKLPGLVSEARHRCVLVTGRNSFQHSPEIRSLFIAVSGVCGEQHHLIIPSEPSPDLIDEAVTSLRERDIGIVIAIGGGSVIDAGKAISVMLKEPGTVTDYLEVVGTKRPSGSRVPFIAVPTTAGTGSEATKNAVITKSGKGGFKRSLRHDNFVPDHAIVDPLLTLSCSPEITAASGLDCLAQLAESFLSVRAGAYTDALALEGLRSVRESLVQCYRHGDDIDARSGMAFAALTSGICLANAGLGSVHGLAGTIGGMFDIPHGVVCGLLLPPANKMNVTLLRKNGDPHGALRKYAMMGSIFSDVTGKTESYYADAFIDFLYGISEELRLKSLGYYGMGYDDIPLICSSSDTKDNPVKLTPEELSAVVKAVL